MKRDIYGNPRMSPDEWIATRIGWGWGVVVVMGFVAFIVGLWETAKHF